MSGHSKWSSIKHKKAAQDAKRGKVFTKLIREITAAARRGGGDADGNPRLRLALDKARAANVPNDTTQRAIAKGVGGGEGDDFQEVVYEGYGPAKVAVVIEALTDNRNRTASTIRTAFTKHHGSLGSTNSVQYMFERKGTFRVAKAALDEETLTDYVLEAGADDLQDDGESWLVTCPLEAFDTVRAYLEGKAVALEAAELARLPQTRVTIEDRELAEQVLSFLDALEEDDDVQKVFSNFDIDERLLEELAS
jgi:YebC/PmpR family DNA-binding regulatory protein